MKKCEKKLETDFKVELSPELKSQSGEEEEEEVEPEINSPIESSMPLKEEQVEEIYNQWNEDILKTALTINKTDLETAVRMTEDSNKAVIDEIIYPTPGLIVDDMVNVDTQLDFEKNDLDANFRITILSRKDWIIYLSK